MENKVSEKEFKKLCEKHLPQYVKVDGIGYRLHCYMLLSGDRFIISYGQYNGECYDWDEPRLLDVTFVLVDKIPKAKLYKPNELCEDVFYCLSIDDIVNDAKEMLIATGYEELEEIVTPVLMFERELTALLNKYSKENASDTPDFILANYLINCLNTYNHTIQVREKWYNREMKIEGHNTDEENFEEVFRFGKELNDANEKAKKGEKFTSADVEKHCNENGYYIDDMWFPDIKNDKNDKI